MAADLEPEALIFIKGKGKKFVTGKVVPVLN
jgi:hypothetical protein